MCVWCGVWCVVCGVWCVVCGVWYVEQTVVAGVIGGVALFIGHALFLRLFSLADSLYVARCDHAKGVALFCTVL